MVSVKMAKSLVILQGVFVLIPLVTYTYKCCSESLIYTGTQLYPNMRIYGLEELTRPVPV